MSMSKAQGKENITLRKDGAGDLIVGVGHDCADEVGWVYVLQVYPLP